MPLFEVAILEHPEKKNGKLERLVDVKNVIARDEDSAKVKAMIGVADVDPDRLEILCRPFVDE